MQHNPLRIARWALAAGFVSILTAACLTSPSPSPAWTIAAKHRYQQRFPVLTPSRETGSQLAIRKPKQRDQNSAIGDKTPKAPLRTAERTAGVQRSRPE